MLLYLALLTWLPKLPLPQYSCLLSKYFCNRSFKNLIGIKYLTSIFTCASYWVDNSNVAVSINMLVVTKMDFAATNVVKELHIATVSAIMQNKRLFLVIFLNWQKFM